MNESKRKTGTFSCEVFLKISAAKTFCDPLPHPTLLGMVSPGNFGRTRIPDKLRGETSVGKDPPPLALFKPPQPPGPLPLTTSRGMTSRGGGRKIHLPLSFVSFFATSFSFVFVLAGAPYFSSNHRVDASLGNKRRGTSPLPPLRALWDPNRAQVEISIVSGRPRSCGSKKEGKKPSKPLIKVLLEPEHSFRFGRIQLNRHAPGVRNYSPFSRKVVGGGEFHSR